MKPFQVSEINHTGSNIAKSKKVMSGTLSENAYQAIKKLELTNPARHEILITDTETEQTDLLFISGTAELRKILTMDKV